MGHVLKLKKTSARTKTRPAEAAKRVPLSLRVTPQLKARLDAAAAETGRSQTQEIEFRLERSFDRQDLLLDVLANAFGPQAAKLLEVVGRALHTSAGWMRVMTLIADSSSNSSAASGVAWPEDCLDNPRVYDQAVKAITSVLERLRPSGDREPRAELAEALKKSGWENFGERVADYVLPDTKRAKRNER
jgi:hypothetical protein